VSHAPRPGHDPRHPVHVTLRAARGLKSLRSEPAFQALSLAVAAASREDFRVVHFSVQTDHVHLIVEAAAGDGLRAGINGLACRMARALNRIWRRHGDVWSDGITPAR
jgi:REP element-mobilizing transposase RayT